MAAEALGGDLGEAIGFLVGVETVAQIFSFAMSSPQTLELAISERAGTMWKWVNLGTINAAAMITIASFKAKRSGGWIALGGGLQLAIGLGMYGHARSSGLAQGRPTPKGYGG